MKYLSSIFQANFRRNFTIFYLLSSALPMLMMIFIIFRYIVPMLDDIQLYRVNSIFSYGVIAMLIPSILSIGLGYQWIGAIEKLSKDIKIKSAQIKGETPLLSPEQSELAAIHAVFNDMHSNLKKNMSKLDDVTKQLLEVNIKLEKMATRDSLTSLFNRRYFDLKLIEEASRAERDQQELSLMMIDFDNFKKYNDEHGHKTGDKLLLDVATIIKNSLRRSDMVFRYGGDEFAVLIPGCNRMIAEQIANQIVTKISETRFTSVDGKYLDRITISCGVAFYAGNLEDFISVADKCLIAAKASGKDCVVTH
jgi:diguanylate cyclase (GGDEF)-like protein